MCSLQFLACYISQKGADVRAVSPFRSPRIANISPCITIDWDESQTFSSTLGGGSKSDKDGNNQPGQSQGQGLDSLWEDNWDDDDIEDEFTFISIRIFYRKLKFYPTC